MVRKSDLDEEQVNLDAISRFERVLDHQITHLETIDNKAEHVMRVIALLLGLLITAVSIVVRANDGLPAISRPVEVSFAIGFVATVVTFAAAVVTYISSRMRFGLHFDAADTLQTTELPMHQYSRLVLNAYASALEDNKAVVDTNNARFRITLGSFLFGVGFIALSISELLLVETAENQWNWTVIGGFAITLISGLVVEGRLLILPNEE